MRVLSALSVLIVAVSVASSHEHVFSDGFETGGVCGWNSVEPVVACYAESTVLLPGFVSMPFIEIPAGTFLMGSDKQAADTDEDVHLVTLSSNFVIGKTEVTQAQWRAMGYVDPSFAWTADGSRPVETVNFYEAAAFANAVSVSEGLSECYTFTGCAGDPGTGMLCSYIGVLSVCDGYRLSTEAQWERAARALTQTRFSHGDVLECGDACEECPLHNQYMVYCENYPGIVTSKSSNHFGLFDMHGNVWELTQDWYQASLGTDPVVDPLGPTSGFERTVRGGAWINHAAAARSASRTQYPMSSAGADVGFRLAREIP